jgi:hypothetical protein
MIPITWTEKVSRAPEWEMVWRPLRSAIRCKRPERKKVRKIFR